MAVRKIQPLLHLFPFLLCFFSSLPQSSSQLISPQNIQVYYPYPFSSPTAPPPNPLPSPSPPPPTPPPPPPELPLSPPPTTTSKKSSNKTVVKAVAATAGSTLVLSGLFFFLLLRYKRREKEESGGSSLHGNNNNNNNNNNHQVLQMDQFVRFDGNVKGVIVDEQGLDVLYWRKLEDGNSNINKASFKKEVLRSKGGGGGGGEKEEEKKIVRIINGDEKSSRKTDSPIPEISLLRGKSSTSHVWPVPEENNNEGKENSNIFMAVGKQETKTQQSSRSPPPTPPPLPSPMPPLPMAAPPLPPVIPVRKISTPPPPPPPPKMGGLVLPSSSKPPPPLPPVIPVRKISTPPPPPPPPKTGGLVLPSSSKPPPPPPANRGVESNSKQERSSSSSGKEGTESGNNSQVKLKPLHWDKVNPNVEHSMVWHKLDNGSFKFDGDLMEALFGTVATNKKSPRGNVNSPSPKGEKSGLPSQIFILDTRKSQNTAIVLRSLAISRREIIDSLEEGRGLNTDTLEKLARIALTQEEEESILAFDGDITRLANAESFLYHILKAVPTAFTRFNAMLFKSNYGSEMSQIKKSLQTLESACTELKNRGLFVKLLEAILKAGNRMNAGTSRGNAQAFNLTSLLKLSDVKSSNGKTTLLHFVVEEVVRLEGKRCMINRNHSLSRNGSIGGLSSDTLALPKDQREKEYITLGLPIVGGVSSEFSNVKKAAGIDYDALSKSCSGLTGCLAKIQKIVEKCAGDVGGRGFVREMERFIDTAEGEIKVVREEEKRVLGLVNRTNEYYQASGSKDKGGLHFQLFVIVRDFLEMVDKACVDITINLQKRRNYRSGPSGSSTSELPNSPDRPSVKFPVLPANFMSDSSKSNSSDSDEGS